LILSDAARCDFVGAIVSSPISFFLDKASLITIRNKVFLITFPDALFQSTIMNSLADKKKSVVSAWHR